MINIGKASKKVSNVHMISQTRGSFTCNKIKITLFENPENVSFNIASEASYVYILSGQKCFKNVILASFWNLEDYGQTVLPDKSTLMGQNLLENVKK